MTEWSPDGHRYPVIGITGPIASGKSEVRKILESRGFFGIDADKVGHQVLETDQQYIKALIDAFGSHISRIDEAGKVKIDREKLAEVVFADSTKLALLDRISHPRITNAIRDMIRNIEQPVVIEAIKLMQSEIKTLCDEIWLVDSSENTRVERLMASRGLTEAQARERIASQANINWDHEAFDAVINSDKPLAEVQQAVEMLLARFKKDFYKEQNRP